MKEVVCENPACRAIFLRYPKDILAHNYCSCSCAAVINNRKFPKRIAQIRICYYCSKKFKKINKISKYCSDACRHYGLRKFGKTEILSAIKDFSKKFQRVPVKREFSQRLASAIRVFGSWNKALEAAGLTPHRSHDHRMYKRTRTTAKDGHQCDSISEAIIDNWLTDNGIAHQRDVKYPNTNHKADWGIGERTFVEYFGLAHDSPRYDREIKKKRAICKKAGINLIAIYPEDLYPQLRLEKKLRVS